MSYFTRQKSPNYKFDNDLSKPLTKPGTIKKQHHDRSPQYANLDNFSIDQSQENDTINSDDAVPPLLDLSLQSITDLDHAPSRSSQYNTERTHQTKHDRKTSKHAQSLYIYEDTDDRTQQYKINNISIQETQSGQNYSVDKNGETQTESIYNNRKTYPPCQDNSIAQQQIQVEYTPILHSIHKIQQPPLVGALHKLQKYGTEKNIEISPMARYAIQIYNKFMHEDQPKISKSSQSQKSTKQILAGLFINPLRLQKYISHLLQASIGLSKKSIDKKKQKQERKEQKMSNSMREEFSYSHQRDISVCKLLGCLLAKIRESSLRSGQNIPEVINKNGQISFNFGSNKIANSSIMESSRSAVSSKHLPDEHRKVRNFEENKKRIKELQQKLNEQDALIQQIKQEYESIINNYSHTIMNLVQKQKHQSLHDHTFSKGPSKPEARGRKNNHIRVQRNSSQQSEEDQADRQLRMLIQNSKRINTAEVFSRLSQQSKKKAQSKRNN